MKKIKLTVLKIILPLLFSNLAMAEWYEATGTAIFVSSEPTARLNALEDALFQAMRFTGADIGTISTLRPFLSDERNEYQFTNHEVRYIRVLETNVSGDKFTLRAQLDIYPSAKGCHVDQYKKTFLVGNIDLASPQQAVMGQIYNVGDDFSHVVNRQLDQESISFVSVGTTDYEIKKSQPETLKMIAQDFNAQYIIGGVITDLTSTISSKLLSSDQTNRQFALEMQVYDGKTGQEVYSKAYREVAEWGFARTSKVDTRSARFWASNYGQTLLRVSRNIMLDLEAELSCKITLPEIIAIHSNNYTIDLGRIHGVKVGDKLQLWHTGSFIDQAGLPRNRVSQSDITLTVTRVFDQEAEVTVDQPELANSIQLGDVMQKQIGL